VRADAIIDGRTAQKAGMMPGDVVIKLGDYAITDIYSYMDALSKYKKGEAATVTVLRENKTITLDIIF
jgi:S1-C subfamily serine protease